MRNKYLMIGAAGAALALPALAQQAAPGPAPQPATANAVGPAAEPTSASPTTVAGSADSLTGIAVVSAENLPEPPPPVELPDHARRDPWAVGPLDPVVLGLGANPWGGASGAFLSGLMRRMGTPIASRWAHIALRNALLADAHAPRNVHPVDWVGERVWLLLRMGEADAARMLVAGVDVDQFTPKMFQVAVQSALADGDPPGLCPLQGGIRKVEPGIFPLVDAMCASLAGEPESAAAQIDSARRRGRIGGIDLVLAQKVVGAGANTGRAVTVEWDPVDRLDSWRFGLATATGLAPPDRLINAAPARVRAWQARAAMLSAQQRLASARIAAGLGVLSSQSLADIYSAIYDSTDPSDLPDTDAWQLRQAFVGRDIDARLGAMRRLWKVGSGSLQREASRAMVARAATRIAPSADLQTDAADLIASMLAGGFDREAARWAGAVGQMDDQYADPAWAMLALAAPDARQVDVSARRISGFIGRDSSPEKRRSALLVAGLAALGRIDGASAGRLNARFKLGIARETRWTRMIDASSRLGQAGSVLILAGTGLQVAEFERIPGGHLFHAVAALRRTGQDFTARMIAAEALART